MGETREFVLPDLGEGLTEAEIVRWLVAPEDAVTVDQPVVEVETAKAVVEVPCPYPGVVVATHGRPGDVIDVGRPLLSVRSDLPSAAAGQAAAAPASGNVLVGYGTQTATRRRRGAGRAQPGAPQPGPAEPVRTKGPPGRAGTSRPAVVSPLVRRLAREHGLDLDAVLGSGPNGLVLRADVERAIASAAAGRDANAPGQRPGNLAREPDAARRDIPPDAPRTPLRGARRTVAEKLARSRREIPDATTWVDVDATELLATREALRSDGDANRIGVLALLARFVVDALRRFPDLNSCVDAGRSEVIRLPFVHLGFAAQTERGLVAPVVRDAHRLSTEELAAEIRRLTEAAHAGALTPAELTGGTFTINNYGVFGVDGATPIINHPEVAMLGVGRIMARPWVVGDQMRIRQVTQLSLSFDHRVCDGGVAGGFVRHVADLVERPARLLRGL